MLICVLSRALKQVQGAHAPVIISVAFEYDDRSHSRLQEMCYESLRTRLSLRWLSARYSAGFNAILRVNVT